MSRSDAIEAVILAAREFAALAITHYGHSDPTRQYGRGCPACLELTALSNRTNAALRALDAKEPA